LTSVLFSGAPGTIAGPVSPPRSKPSRESTRSPAIGRFAMARQAVRREERPDPRFEKRRSPAVRSLPGAELARAQDRAYEDQPGNREEEVVLPRRGTQG
jgi:hypothetical protein